MTRYDAPTHWQSRYDHFIGGEYVQARTDRRTDWSTRGPARSIGEPNGGRQRVTPSDVQRRCLQLAGTSSDIRRQLPGDTVIRCTAGWRRPGGALQQGRGDP